MTDAGLEALKDILKVIKEKVKEAERRVKMPKIGGISWNNSQGSKTGVTDKFSCPHCRRQYKMDWALQNHVKVCPLNPNRYGRV